MATVVVTVTYDYSSFAGNCYWQGTIARCTQSKSMSADALPALIQSWNVCGVSQTGPTTWAFDYTGRCSSVSLWCSATTSYFQMITCGNPAGLSNSSCLWL